jgi:hypothetical protein
LAKNCGKPPNIHELGAENQNIAEIFFLFLKYLMKNLFIIIYECIMSANI